MYWKLAGYTKQEGEIYTPCVHNTVGIPDNMVIADSTDVPVVSMRYDYESMEARTYGEVVELIKCMNEKGKFVSKEWLCNKLNFKSRKADDIISNLKKQGVVVEMYPVRHAKKLGCFYRMAGNEWKRRMQKAHASIRREQRAFHREIYSPKKGSHNEQPFPILSDSGDNEKVLLDEVGEAETHQEENYGFEKIYKGRVPIQKKNFEDGMAGDGRENTCYTAPGCFARITYPENPEFELVDVLVGLSNDQYLTPALARSIARRIDSGLISEESVAKMQSIFEANPNLAYNLRDLIYNYEEILAEHSERFHKLELHDTATKINNIVEGTPSTSLISLELKRAINLFHAADGAKNTHTDEQLIVMCSETSIPIYSKIAALSASRFSRETMVKLVNEFKSALYKQIAENKFIYNLFKKDLKFDFIDWSDFYKFFKQYIADLKCSLYINKLRNPKLDWLFNIIKMKSRKNEFRTQQCNYGYGS